MRKSQTCQDTGNFKEASDRKRFFLCGEPGVAAIRGFSLSTFNLSFVGVYLREPEHGTLLFDASGDLELQPLIWPLSAVLAAAIMTSLNNFT